MSPQPSIASETDPKLAHILDEYLAALQTGTAPTQEELLARYPDQAPDLKECLASLDFIRQAAVDAVPAEQISGSPPLSELHAGALGDYRIIKEIGRGGMGVVYEAVQISLDRRVALKVLPFAATLDAKHLQRFKNEAHAAAQLHHNNIVPVFGVGCERGVHYYAMQYVEGQTLAAIIGELRQLERRENPGTRIEDRESKIENRNIYKPEYQESATVNDQVVATETPSITPRSSILDSRSSTFFRTVAQLGIQAAQALEHAHGLGVIHRDIKPANLLLDVRGNLWITDFGLAHSHSDAGLTMTGDLLGTLRYMSPEQALAKRELVDHRADVYGLGATLYELLTLEPAFAGRDRQELLRQIAFDEPRPLRQVNPLLPADLETIVLKAISKEPESRYGTAQDLADDLRRFLDDHPIRAKRPTLVQRARKWARRHRAIVLAGLVLLVMALVASIISTILIWQAQQRTEAALGQALINQQAAEAHWARAEEEKETRRRYLHAADMNLALQAWETGRVSRALELLERHKPGPGEEDLRGFEWYYLWRQCRRGHRLTLRGHGGPVRVVAFLPGDKKLVSGSEDGTIRLWDIISGDALASFPAHAGGVYGLAATADGKTLVSGGADGRVKVWELPTARERWTVQLGGIIGAVAISPDQKLMAAGGESVVLLDAESGQELARLQGHPVNSLAFSPDGRTLASASNDRSVKLWDLTSRQERLTLKGHKAYVFSVAFSPDGKTLASASDDLTAKLWDVATGQPLAEFRHGGGVPTVAFLPDGKNLLSGSEEGALRLWSIDAASRVVREGEAPAEPPRGEGSPRGSPSRRASPMVRAQSSLIYAVAVSGDGKLLASGSLDGTIDLWDREAFQEDPNPVGHTKPVHALAFSPDGRTLASGSEDQTIKLWDVATGRQQATLQAANGWVPSLAYSPDGSILASTCTKAGNIQFWDLSSADALAAFAAGGPRNLATVRAHDSSSVWCVAFSPDGKTLASAGYQDKTVKLWDLTSRPPRCLATLRGHTDSVWSVAFSPDGKTLVSGGRDNTARLWDLATGKERTPLRGHRGWVWAVAFSPDGKTLATASQDGSVKLWDPVTGREIALPLKGHAAFVRCLAFFPDGKTLVTGGDDGTAKLWDLVSLQERASFKEQEDCGGVWSLAISPDGKTLATGSGTGRIKLWRAGAP